MTWFLENIGTIAVLAVLAAIVAWVIVHLVRQKKAGKSSCGCGCSGCAMKDSCHGGTHK